MRCALSSSAWLLRPPDFVLLTKLPPVVREGNSGETSASSFFCLSLLCATSDIHVSHCPRFSCSILYLTIKPIYQLIFDYKMQPFQRGNKIGKSLQKLCSDSKTELLCWVVPVRFQPQNINWMLRANIQAHVLLYPFLSLVV